MIPSSENKILYWLLRSSVFGLGLLLVATAAGPLVYPEVVYSEGVFRLFWQQILFDVILLFYGLLLLAPHRWFLRQPFFIGKMLFLSVGFFWAAYGFFSIVYFGRSEKNWFIITFSSIVVLLTLLAPFTLVFKRRSHIAEEMRVFS